MQSASNYARTEAMEPTDLVTSVVSATTSPNVVVADANWASLCGFVWWSSSSSGGGLVGLATCDSLSGSSCAKHSVYYQEPFTSSTTTSNRRGLACHEFGHTVGLIHRTDTSCTQQGYPKPSLVCGSHDTAHINAAY